MRRADIALPPSKISRTFNLFALALRRPRTPGWFFEGGEELLACSGMR